MKNKKLFIFLWKGKFVLFFIAGNPGPHMHEASTMLLSYIPSQQSFELKM
jgi:hypothetical protein